MPQRKIDKAEVSYYLLCLDRDGKERPENGTLLSDTIADAVADAVTDVCLAIPASLDTPRGSRGRPDTSRASVGCEPRP